MTVNLRLTILIIFSVIFFWNTNSIAEEKGASAIQQMATIMHRLKHFPSPQGKETLRAIIANNTTTAHERTLAMAMLNLNHRPTAADKKRLQAMMK